MGREIFMSEMSDKQKKMIEEMRKAQQEQKAIQSKTGRSARGGSSVEQPKPQQKPQQPKMSEDERVKQLEEQLKRAKAEKADLKDKLANNSKEESYKQEQEALNDIVRNNDDYHFAKEYTVSTTKGRSRKIVIKMHAPSVSEQAEIQQEYTDLTRGRGSGFTRMAQDLFLAISFFRVVGDNVPKWFTDVDNTYRVDILFDVWEDYNDWLNSFLNTQLQ